MIESSKVIKQLEYLASAGWPIELDHWRSGAPALLADAHGMFLYADSRAARARRQSASC